MPGRGHRSGNSIPKEATGNLSLSDFFLNSLSFKIISVLRLCGGKNYSTEIDDLK